MNTRLLVFSRVLQNRLVIKKATQIALIVGTLLNLINQPTALLGGAIETLVWSKFLLTYCVPFGVSVYMAYSIELSRQQN